MQPTMFQIISELVNHFGGEQLGKILIKGIQEEVIIPIKTTKINKNKNNLQLEYQIEDQKFFYQVEEIK